MVNQVQVCSLRYYRDLMCFVLDWLDVFAGLLQSFVGRVYGKDEGCWYWLGESHKTNPRQSDMEGPD